MSKAFERIKRGLEQALAYAEGRHDPTKVRVHIVNRVVEVIDVKSIRAKLGMSQVEFANKFGFNVNTLRHWEQGKRQPMGAARAYLLVIDRDPKAVSRALQPTRIKQV